MRSHGVISYPIVRFHSLLSSRGLKARGDPLRTSKRRDKSYASLKTRWIAASLATLPPRNDKECMVIKPHTAFLTAHCIFTTPCHREGILPPPCHREGSKPVTIHCEPVNEETSRIALSVRVNRDTMDCRVGHFRALLAMTDCVLSSNRILKFTTS